MKQVIQNIRSGSLTVETVPAPCVAPGHVLIANGASLISAGTEKMVMDLAKKSLLGKARNRPDHVQRVLRKIRNEGLFNTIDAVWKKLDEPMTMGYSSAGTVLACGAGVQNFKPGQRIASNGPHAEIVCVPEKLCAGVPDKVTTDHASFAVLGSIAMQGVRLSQCNLGETVFVIGLGLVGQLTVAIAKAAGYHVIGTDPDQSRCELAVSMGADRAKSDINATTVQQLTGGLGADAVIITASTNSNGPIELSAASVRQKGRVVLVGVVGLNIDRRPFYFKEAEFVVSCSYGPGRYDVNYERRGHDYPAAYVRWTEQRNISAVLKLMSTGSLDVGPLISHTFDIGDATRAYDLIESGSEPFLGIVLKFPEQTPAPATRIQMRPKSAAGNRLRYGLLGAGNFARMIMLPAIAKCSEFEPVAICSGKGVSGTHLGKQAKFEISTTDEDEVFRDPSVSTIFSLTRHDQHASHVIKAIQHSKNVFVEKPLCLSVDELLEIEQALESHESPPAVMVGFNRRFSRPAVTVRQAFANSVVPLTVSIRFNAGDIPADHWTQNDAEGGGRIIGEACHAIDLATYLTGSLPVRVFAESVCNPDTNAVSDDQCFITLRHANGSISSIGYLAGGDKAFGKERIEVVGDGKVGIIDDFRATTISEHGKTRTTKGRMDKGHQAEVRRFAECLSSGTGPPIEWCELRAVTLASILAVRSLREGLPLDVLD